MQKKKPTPKPKKTAPKYPRKPVSPAPTADSPTKDDVGDPRVRGGFADSFARAHDDGEEQSAGEPEAPFISDRDEEE